jgi:hypothetical protein
VHIFPPRNYAGYPRWACSNAEFGFSDQNWPDFVYDAPPHVAVVVNLAHLHSIFKGEAPDA